MWRTRLKAAGAALALLFGLALTAPAQISPGPLSKMHKQLEGSLNCTKCHGLKKGAMNDACLSCHKEIGALIESGRGLHARDAKGSCAKCHPEHAGLDFDLIKWNEGSAEKFDHKRTGWELEQKHGETKCKDCHKTEFRKGEIADLSPRKTGAGWVGLETACLACHEDYHKKALGQNCLKCHDVAKWKPAPHFDHDSTTYPLTGKHADPDLKCAKCHEAKRLNPELDKKGKVIPVFKPVSHKDCVDCHTDVHKGQFKGGCFKCHQTTGWHNIKTAGFDHDQTKYPLRGKHEQLSCAKCHPGFPVAKESLHPLFGKCTDCHADPHDGKATLAGKVVDCESCHNVSGFTPSTYTVAMHAKAKYVLEGKHTTVKCGSCHKTKTIAAQAGQLVNKGKTAQVAKQIDIRPLATGCLSCHTVDDHGTQLAGRSDKGSCDACHKVAGWTPSTFTVAQHAKLKLALDGRHAEIKCGDCHSTTRLGLPPIPSPEKLGKAHVLLKLNETACAQCHGDAHGGRFTTGQAKVIYAGGCTDCHNAVKFRPSTYDFTSHAKSGFALDGAHRAVPCVGCHAELKQGPMKSTLVLAKAGTTMPFKPRPQGCVGCHENPHGDQFAHRRDRGLCEGCHGVESFKPAAKFDHDKDAAFPLAGAHAKVPCADCHKPLRGGPKAVQMYRPLSPKCESCHANPVRQ